jgi:hypothetical protein
MTTITICSSVNFYRQVLDVAEQLETMGYGVIVPKTALEMKKTGDFDADHHRTWLADPDDYDKKAELMRAHFVEIEKGDVILIVNNEKRGVQNYIGGNVLMEMALAFYLKKPIFLLNDIPEDSAFLEEIIGMGSVPLHGKVEDFTRLYEQTRD